MAQNPEIGVGKREIIPKFTYVTKRRTCNRVIIVSAQTRKKLIDNTVKIGWINCSTKDYLFATRSFRCSRFNHRMRDCRGTETRPLCADNHNLKEYKSQPTDTNA